MIAGVRPPAAPSRTSGRIPHLEKGYCHARDQRPCTNACGVPRRRSKTSEIPAFGNRVILYFTLYSHRQKNDGPKGVGLQAKMA